MPLDQDDAIPSDVPNNPTETPAAAEAKPVEKSARELALEAIEARHHQQVAEENGFTLEPDPDQLAAQLAEPAPEPAPAPVAAAPAPAADAPKVKVKVDGVEGLVTPEEIRNYQIGKTADKRLAEATQLQRENMELQARLQQQLMAPAPQAAPQPHSAPAPETTETGKEFLKALFEGDEDTALAKLSALTQGRQPQAPIPDLNQLTDAVAQQVQQKLVIENALAQHRRDYPQIYADPDLESLALAKTQRAQAADGGDFFTALNAVSAEFATKFGWQPAPAIDTEGRDAAVVPPTTPPRTAKLERKGTIDNITSIGAKTSSTEPIQESVSDVIAQMAAQRLGR